MVGSFPKETRKGFSKLSTRDFNPPSIPSDPGMNLGSFRDPRFLLVTTHPGTVVRISSNRVLYRTPNGYPVYIRSTSLTPRQKCQDTFPSTKVDSLFTLVGVVFRCPSPDGPLVPVYLLDLRRSVDLVFRTYRSLDPKHHSPWVVP